jgi:hypothetical protein
MANQDLSFVSNRPDGSEQLGSASMTEAREKDPTIRKKLTQTFLYVLLEPVFVEQ